MSLTTKQKAKILDQIEGHIEKRFYNPVADLNGWREAWPKARPAILETSTDADFEAQVNQALASLRSSHVSFFHASGARIPAPYALNATFLRSDEDDPPVWVFEDVLEGGIADRAGIVFGESLAAVNGVPVLPPDMPRFDLGSRLELTILGRDLTPRTVSIQLPPKSPKGRPPLVEVQAVHSRKLTDDVGYVRVAYFPGAVGHTFAAAYEKALADLGPITGLVIDLRGNPGGGLGSLRVMSSLCPDRRPIGYNVTRRFVDKGLRPEDLPCIDHIPSTKLGLLKMALRFKLLNRDRSIALATEGLGPRPFHGRIAILINQHTKSAAEMIAAFAAANNLATLIGSRTAGEVLGAVNFVLGDHYRLRLPIGGWMTQEGRVLESLGVAPSVEASASASELRLGRNLSLEAAIDLLCAGAKQ